MSDERQTMVKFLETSPCPHCNSMGSLSLSGMVYYTAPLQWSCKCSVCNGIGEVGYDSIPHILLPPDKEAELIAGEVEDVRTFLDQYGTEEEKGITVSLRRINVGQTE